MPVQLERYDVSCDICRASKRLDAPTTEIAKGLFLRRAEAEKICRESVCPASKSDIAVKKAV